ADAVAPALWKWVATRLSNADGPSRADEPHLLEALWALDSIDRSDGGLVLALLNAHDPGIRDALVRVESRRFAAGVSPMDVWKSADGDEHPRVRLEGVRGVANWKWPDALEVASRGLDKAMDPWLDYALWLTARELEPVWMPALKRGETPFDNVNHLIFALQATDAGGAVPTIVGLIKSGKLRKEDEHALLELLADSGGPRAASLLFATAM